MTTSALLKITCPTRGRGGILAGMVYEQHTAYAAQRRRRQFGILELLALTTCLAFTLGLYVNIPGGVVIALVLTTSLATIGWHAKRIEYLSEIPGTYNFVALVLLSLVLELLLAWANGYYGAHLRPLYYALVSVRIVLLIFGGGAVIFACVHWFSGDTLPWEHPTQRIGLSGKIAVAVLCVPMMYATPLFHYGVLQSSRSVDVAALVAECKLHDERPGTFFPPYKRYPILHRLGVTSVRANDDGGYWLACRNHPVSYRLEPAMGNWELWVQCDSLSWRRVHFL